MLHCIVSHTSTISILKTNHDLRNNLKAQIAIAQTYLLIACVAH